MPRNGLLPDNTYGPIDDLTLHYLSGTNRFDYVEDGVDIPCTLTYDLADTQNTSATYRAEQSITSTQTITNNVTVSYHAGDSITLDSNFQVDTNSIFSAIIEPCRHPLAGFVDSDSTYHYDGNGNITYDPDRNITIYYNYLNLPDSVMLDGGQWIRFTYAADGTKLKKANSTGDVKHYINGVEYLGGDMEAIYHAEGRAVPDSMGGFRYEYTLKDHLGNSRVMFSDLNGDETVDETEILQENHYYPFGMNMQGAWGVGTNQYQYNGKEIDNDFGVNWYHYGARMFDPAIGRFTGVDPIADRFAWVSTYNYAENRPINSIDLHGLQSNLSVELQLNKEIEAFYEASLNMMSPVTNTFAKIGNGITGLFNSNPDPSDFHDSGNTHEGSGITVLGSTDDIDGSGQLPLDNAKGGSEVIVETQDFITTTSGNIGGFVRNNSKGAGMVRDFSKAVSLGLDADKNAENERVEKLSEPVDTVCSSCRRGDNLPHVGLPAISIDKNGNTVDTVELEKK